MEVRMDRFRARGVVGIVGAVEEMGKRSMYVHDGDDGEIGL